jgi:hypothetical protein
MTTRPFPASLTILTLEGFQVMNSEISLPGKGKNLLRAGMFTFPFHTG